jgi:hypothetical protein
VNEDKRRTEHERREATLCAPTSDVELEARQVPAREIRQMLSVPMEPQLIRELRSVGLARGIAVSDLLREATAALVERERRRTVRLQPVPSKQDPAPAAFLELRYSDREQEHGSGGLASSVTAVI